MTDEPTPEHPGPLHYHWTTITGAVLTGAAAGWALAALTLTQG